MRLVFYNNVAWMVINFGGGLRCVTPMVSLTSNNQRGPMRYYGYGKLKRDIDERLANGS